MDGPSGASGVCCSSTGAQPTIVASKCECSAFQKAPIPTEGRGAGVPTKVRILSLASPPRRYTTHTRPYVDADASRAGAVCGFDLRATLPPVIFSSNSWSCHFF